MALSHDQFDNAARLQRLGVGRGIRPSAYRGPQVAKHLLRLINSAAVRDSCQRLAQRIASMAAVEESCRVIESLPRRNQRPA